MTVVSARDDFVQFMVIFEGAAAGCNEDFRGAGYERRFVARPLMGPEGSPGALCAGFN